MKNPSITAGAFAGNSEASTQTLPAKMPPVNSDQNLTEAVRYALEYAALGRPVFPIRALDKRPVANMTWTVLATSDRETILAWAERHPDCNWAVDVGRSGLCVLDVDNKTDDRHGDKSMAELAFGHDVDLGETFTVATPNSGLHHYYSGVCKSAPKLVAGGKTLKGIETKSDGGYVLIPGSRILVGGKVKTYRVINDQPVAPLPAELLKMAGPARGDREADPGTKMEAEVTAWENADSDTSISWATHFLAEVAEEATYGSRNPTALQTACRLRDHGITESTAVALMESIYNPHRVHPPLESAELRFTIRNAYRYAAGAFGAKAVSFEALTDEAPELLAFERAEKAAAPASCHLDLETLSASLLLRTKPEPIRYHFRNSLPAGEVGFVAGPSGAGKSFWLLAAAVAAAGGVDAPLAGAFELADTTPAKVFYLAAEDSSPIIAHRLHAVLDAHAPLEDFDGRADDAAQAVREAVAENLFIKSGVGQNVRLMDIIQGQPRPSAFFKALLSTFKGAEFRLIVLDPLSRLFAGSENDNGLATAFCEMLENLAAETGATVLCAHHTGKPGSTSKHLKGLDAIQDRLGADRMRGASAFTAAVRWQAQFATIRPEEAKAIGAAPDESWRHLAMAVPKLNHGVGGGLSFMCRNPDGVLHTFIPSKRPIAGLEKLPEMIVSELSRLEQARIESGRPPTTLRQFARVCAATLKADMPAVSRAKVEEEIEVLELAGKVRVIEHQKPGSRKTAKCITLAEAEVAK